MFFFISLDIFAYIGYLVILQLSSMPLFILSCCFLWFILQIDPLMMAAVGAATQQKVVVVGGGIHGVSLAYYLTQRGIKPLIVEKTSIAAAASGKAGGFLAREWGSGPTVQLHQKSFDMHRELADKFNIESYRQVNTLSVDSNHKGSNPASWLDKKVRSELMDTATAQVTPKEYTEKVLEAAKAAGAEILIDTVIGIATELSNGAKSNSKNIDRKIVGVKTANNGLIPASAVAICLGPWSGVASEDWLGLSLPMQGIKSTSLVFQDLQPIRAQPFACFCAEDTNDCHLELYPRPNGIVYSCSIIYILLPVCHDSRTG